MMKHLFFLQVVLPHVMGIGWSVNIPQKIRALSGDCVVIPCSYTLPASERNKMKEIMWYQGETQDIIFNSKHRSKKYKASLTDDFKVGNCSLWIRDITRADSMMYRLLIELTGVRNYSSPSSVDLRVSDVPASPELQISSENIMEGDRVIMTCMMNHTCNLRPLSLSWNHILGEISEKTADLGNGIWQFVSTQIITSSVSHHGLPVRCQATYMKIKASPWSRSYIMNVLYSPRNTTATVSAGEIREGDNVSLSCSSQSNPEVSHYIWNGLTDNGTIIPLTGNQSTILISNINPNMRSVYCTAQNSVGSQTSPVVELDMTYQPQITEQSHCRPMLIVMQCTCIVKANPPPFIIWRLPNFNITKTEEGYDVSTSFSDHVTKSLLKGPASAITSVSCYSENKEGANELLLPVYLDITKYLVIAGAVGIAALFMVAVTVKLRLSSRKTTEEKNKIKNNYCSTNQYDCQPYSSHGRTESFPPLYGNTEFGTRADKEMRKSTLSYDLYSLYECPNFQEEPACFEEEPACFEEEPDSFEEEPDSFEEDAVYANT